MNQNITSDQSDLFEKLSQNESDIYIFEDEHKS